MSSLFVPMFPPTIWCLIIIIFCHLFLGIIIIIIIIIIKLGTILNNEASVLESFFQILGMAGKYFSI
jgi:hypothetical protein